MTVPNKTGARNNEGSRSRNLDLNSLGSGSNSKFYTISQTSGTPANSKHIVVGFLDQKNIPTNSKIVVKGTPS